MKIDERRLLAVGDIHGDLIRFRVILKDARLIDGDDNWIGGDAVLIQLGDMIDRNPIGQTRNGAFDFLKLLQRKAADDGGKVIRLLGNHELMILQGESIASPKLDRQLLEFKNELWRDVMAGTLLGAFSSKGWFFTHSGLRSELREVLCSDAGRNLSLWELAARINVQLMQSVENDTFSHPIFDVDHWRGGSDPFSGIFWQDFHGLALDELATGDMKQIVGHTPVQFLPYLGDDAIIERGVCVRNGAVDIDSGISRTYHGLLTYVEVESGFLTHWMAEDERSEWTSKTYSFQDAGSILQAGHAGSLN